MYTPFLGALEARSRVASAGRRMNVYPEIDKDGKSIAALYGTPGLIHRVTPMAAAVRSLWTVGSSLYAVIGNALYSISTGWVATKLGGILTSAGRAPMVDNGTQLLIVDGVSGYICTIASGVLATITDPDFPGAHTCAYMDGYGIVEVPDTGRFMITSLNDFSSVDALDFATAEGAPDALRRVFVDHRELILFGIDSSEIWDDTGNPDFPFSRKEGTFMEVGIDATHSAAKMNNSVHWLGGNKEGRGIVYKMNGYTPQRISDHKLEKTIQGYAITSDAIGDCYQQEGHSFYVLTFPSENATWVYDAAASAAAGQPEWHERGYWSAPLGDFIRHRANCYAYFNGQHVVGDYENGKIYTLDLDTYTDAGDPLIALVRDRHIHKDMKRLKHKGLQIDFETGVGLTTGQGSDPQAMLRFSDDNGRTWSNELSRGIGAKGDYKKRVEWGRLGAPFDRVYELRISDPVKRAIVGANLDLGE